MFATEHQYARQHDDDQGTCEDVGEPCPCLARIVVQFAETAQDGTLAHLLKDGVTRGEVDHQIAVAAQKDLERVGIGKIVLYLLPCDSALGEPCVNLRLVGSLLRGRRELVFGTRDRVLAVERVLMVEGNAADGVHQQHARKDVTQFAVRNTAPLAEACSARKRFFH